jgi:hypothetical protein
MATVSEATTPKGDEAKKQSNERSCAECKKQVSIYQCPGCNIRTCSLECCRGHKERSGCTGKRNRGTFQPLSRMTDSSLRSDYFFLEEVLDQIPKNQKRTKLDNNPISNLSKKARRLVQQAERRGTTLQIMPPMMERRKSNTSWYCAPRDMITWKLEVIVYPERKSIRCQLSENEENIMDHISNQCEKQGISLLKDYMLFVKQLPGPAKDPRYIQLHPADTLKKALKDNTVIEHPTIYCVPAEHVQDFPTGSCQIMELSTTDQVQDFPTGTDKIMEPSADEQVQDFPTGTDKIMEPSTDEQAQDFPTGTDKIMELSTDTNPKQS